MTDESQAKAVEVVEQIKIHVRRDSLANVNWLLVRQAIEAALHEAYEKGKADEYARRLDPLGH